MMTIRYELTEAEFCRAHRTHLRQSLFTVKNVMLLSFALLLGFLQAQALGPQSWATRIFFALWCGVVGFILYAYWALPPRLFRRFYSQNPGTEIELKKGPEGPMDVRQGESQRRLQAEDVSHVTRQRDLLLIHPKNGVPIAIPERALASSEDQDTLHGFLARSL